MRVHARARVCCDVVCVCTSTCVRVHARARVCCDVVCVCTHMCNIYRQRNNNECVRTRSTYTSSGVPVRAPEGREELLARSSH